jgi:hypothetical protein
VTLVKVFVIQGVTTRTGEDEMVTWLQLPVAQEGSQCHGPASGGGCPEEKDKVAVG